MKTDNRLTISLTGRPPVSITKSAWPVLVRVAHDRDECGNELSRRYCLTVRQHADGRALVYGSYESSWQGERGYRAGELHPAGADLAAAIGSVGEEIGAPGHVITDAIEQLPAEIL